MGIDLAKVMIDCLLKEHKVFNHLKRDETKSNEGFLSIDATVIPGNITYPTDSILLNTTNEETEKLIDELYKTSSLETKSRTYRKKARNDYLAYAKKKNMSKVTRFTAISKQFQYF